MDTRITLLAGLATALGGGAFFMGSGDGEYYEIDRANAATLLVNAPMPDHFREADGLAEVKARRIGNSRVEWRVMVARAPFAPFSADLEPDGAGTRVSVAFALADNALGNAARKDLGKSASLAGEIMELALAEHVDSVMERRPFDDGRMEREIMKIALRNPEAIKNLNPPPQAGSKGLTATEVALKRQIAMEYGVGSKDSDPEGWGPPEGGAGGW